LKAIALESAFVALVLFGGAPAEAGIKFSRQELTVPGDLLWLTTGDLDGDGKTDIVLSYRRGTGPHATKFIGVFFRQDSGYAPHPEIAIQAPKSAALFDVGDAFGDGRQQIVYFASDGVYAQALTGRKAQAPMKVLSTSSLVGESEEDDVIAWDFMRVPAANEPETIIVPTRGPLKLFRREENAWKLWSKVYLDLRSYYDAEMSTFRRDRRGGSTGRPYAFRSTTIVPLLDFVDQTGDGKVDLVASFEDRVAVYPRLDDGKLAEKALFNVWFNVRTPTELQVRDAGVYTLIQDLDGDGVADACVTKIAGGITTLATEVRLYRGLKGGGFEEKPAQIFKDEGFGALASFIDVDGDGKLEMVHPRSSVSIMAISQMMLKRELSLDLRIRRASREKGLFFDREEVQRLETVFGLDLSVGATMRGAYPILGYDLDGDGLKDAIVSEGGGKMVVHKGVRKDKEVFEGEGHVSLEAPGASTTIAFTPSLDKPGRPDVLIYYVDRSDLAGKIYVFKNASD
jgi:VCBS repeat protein